ncbi:hypothetical protein SAMN05421820_101566 [Pedobacter steynii]|uniref:DUF4382 domain-containing protein n=1 Tax=Pedobacter steynii TaxID=430522 RepID=A0A1G9KFX7_9SPHI|nr:hypothetical protein [Pedobacter steynii]NQX38538.1 hypothetical protein [Pedobacter steynii]SDL48549.1 hypothetical protein SAMN05421820_101566 [Pedobacter steynii]
MKSILSALSLLCIILMSGCQKKEFASPDQGRVISLKLSGVSTALLEFIYKDSVVATTQNSSEFVINTLLAVGDGAAKLEIRKKGSIDILQSQTILASPYNQNVSIYYDGDKLYDGLVKLGIKGYALSGELEFLSQGKVILSGTGVIDNSNNPAPILINKGEGQEVQVRKKGETAILFTKTIEASPSKQSLNFFFDGTSIVGNVQLDPPVDPKNMMIKAKFQTTFPNQFKGVDVDLVFYTRLTSAANTIIGTKMIPELLLKLPKDGSFNTLELPPLPGSNYIYSFDIVESGTYNLPYTSGSPLVVAGFTLKQNEGRYGILNFEAGKSKLLLLKDSRALVAATKSIYPSGAFTDLSQYFQ